MSESEENGRRREDQERELKVTDRRMFTPDGKLREEYAFLEDERTEATAGGAAGAAPPEEPAEEPSAGTGAERAAAAAPPAGEAPGSAPQRPPGDPAAAGGEAGGRVEIPSTGPEEEKPGFLDLVAVLAEPVSIYLGDAELPDGRSAENLDAARLYIDLLDVLREKTRSNLTAQESRLLEDLLYRLRMRYVQKRG